VVTDRVGIADEIEPPGRHPLGMPGRGKEMLDTGLISVGARVGEIGLELGGRRRQAGEVERAAADERDGQFRDRIGRMSRLKSGAFSAACADPAAATTIPARATAAHSGQNRNDREGMAVAPGV